MSRMLTYAEAVREAQADLLADDPNVYLIGLGIPGAGGIFGTTSGLAERFGPMRVMDTPNSEQALAGIALGSTVVGMRPIIIHARVDFAILSMDQVVNQIAKWHFMYGGQLRAPIVIRMVIGRGWGQGPQHSQSLQAWFAHIPGLKVIMPVTPYDAKGMLISAVRDDSPVLIFEHRWLYGVEGHVPEGLYDVPLDRARLALSGRHITLAATSFMVLESLRAASLLAPLGIEAEVLDLRAIAPMDHGAIIESVRRTGAIIAIDTGTASFGTAAEILAVAVEGAHGALKYAPRRIGLPNVPSPASPSLADAFFPRAWQIARTACEVLGVDPDRLPPEAPSPQGFYDVPDSSFKGPY